MNGRAMGARGAAEERRRRGVGPDQGLQGGAADPQDEVLALQQARGGGDAPRASGEGRELDRVRSARAGDGGLRGAGFGGVVSDDRQQSSLTLLAGVVPTRVVATGTQRDKGSVLARRDAASERDQGVQKDHVTIPAVLRPRRTSGMR